MHNILHQTPEKSTDQEFRTAADVQNWYRNIRPDVNMREIPLDTHIDAIATSVLDLVGTDVPENAADRYVSALQLTTDIKGLTQKLAIEGDRALPVVDLILELSERDDESIPASVQRLLIEAALNTAWSVRENPNCSQKAKIAANAKLSNIRLEQLRKYKLTSPDYSDDYIQIVRQEAHWFSNNTTGVATGDLFESYIGCLARYQAWMSEADDKTFIRHATQREDQPNRVRDGGSGHAFAHDVHIFTTEGDTLIQCKWGGGAHESEDKYDESVEYIAETTDDGNFSNNNSYKEAFAAIANSGKSTKHADSVDRNVSRYNLTEVLSKALRSTPKTVGALALTNSH